MSIELETIERSAGLDTQPRQRLLNEVECRNLNTILIYNEQLHSNVDYCSSKKAAIHLAVECLDTYAVKAIVQNEEENINVKDDNGNTPLHIAVKLKNVHIIKILLQRSDLNINEVNDEGQTALHLALDYNDQIIVWLLFTTDGVDIDLPNSNYDGNGIKNCRKIIQEKFPDTPIHFFTLLHDRKIKEFINLVKTNSYSLKGDTEYIYLQYACKNGLTEVVKTLLDLGADPNRCDIDDQPLLLLLAAFNSHHGIFKVLLENPNTLFETGVDGKNNVFHALLYGIIKTEHFHQPKNENCDYKQCLRLLLSENVLSKVDINAQDFNGNTVLDLVAQLDGDDFVKMILQSPVYIGQKNRKGKYPFIESSVKSSIIEESLNHCIYTNDHTDSKNENYAIIFDYRMLVPAKTTKFLFTFMGKTINLKPCETEPLLQMCNTAHHQHRQLLLQHPLLLSFYHLKWHRYKHRIIFRRVVSYSIFLVYLTFFLYQFLIETSSNTRVKDPYYSNEPAGRIILWYMLTSSAKTIVELSPVKNYGGFSDEIFLMMVLFHLIVALLAVMLVVGITLYIFMEKLFDYIMIYKHLKGLFLKSAKQWIVIGAYGIAPLLLFTPINCMGEWNKIYAILILFLNWVHLTFLLREMPKMATYIAILEKVSKNFFILLMLYFPVIAPFAFSFFFLYFDNVPNSTEGKSNITENSNLFHTLGLSFFKTFVMMGGGFDDESIPTELNSNFSFGHIIFLLFLFFVPTVLFSSLNGLTVNEIKAIKADAKTIGILTAMKIITFYEILNNITDIYTGPSLCHKIIRCVIPLKEGNKKRKHFKQSPINFFSGFLPDSKVYLYSNRNNAVIINCSDCSLDSNNPPKFFFQRYQLASKMDPEIVEASMKILEKRKEQCKKVNHRDLLEGFYHKIKDKFKNEYSPKMDQFESKLDTFQNEYSQKIDHFESKLDTFQNEYSQKIDQFESKSDTFQNEYSQKLDHFESKSDTFQNEYSQKMDQLESKMDQFESKLDTFRNEYSQKFDQFNTIIAKILNLLEHNS